MLMSVIPANVTKTPDDYHFIFERLMNLMSYALQADCDRSQLQAIEQIIQCPIAVVSSKGELLYNGTVIPQELLLAQWPWDLQSSWIRRGGWQGLRVPLIHKKHCIGFVYFIRSSNMKLSNIEEALYMQAASVIAHQLGFAYRDNKKNDMNNDFSQLLQQYFEDDLTLNALTAYAKKWSISWIHSSYRCILIEMNKQTSQSSSDWNQYMKFLFCDAAFIDIKLQQIYMNNTVLLFIPVKQLERASALHEVLEKRLNSLPKRMNNAAICRIVIGARRTGVNQLLEAYEDCVHTAQLCRDWLLSEVIVDQEYIDLQLLFENVTSHQVEQYVRYWLGALLPGAEGYTEELFDTLVAYLDCDGQINEAAKRLFLHRNTINYRIEKISELLGLNVKQLTIIVRLKLALQLYQFINTRSLTKKM